MVGRTGNFKQFCMSHATPKHVDITDSMDINPSYEGVVAITITNLKNKIDIFDRISIPYIEDRFENEYDVKACLDLKDMGDIPDGIINRLSMGLYDKMFNDLTNEQQAIIKVFSTYICIVTY